MRGCWCVMLSLESPNESEFDAAFVHNSALSWIARDNSKPGRQSSVETWRLHASPSWTEQNLSAPNAEVEETLLAKFGRVIGSSSLRAVHQDSHLWTFALPEEPLSEPFLFDEQLSIGACGDWCKGPRVEGAFLIGLSVTQRILQSELTSAC